MRYAVKGDVLRSATVPQVYVYNTHKAPYLLSAFSRMNHAATAAPKTRPICSPNAALVLLA